MSNPTPRTDAMVAHNHAFTFDAARLFRHAKKLEIELADMTKQRDDLKRQLAKSKTL